MEQRTKANHTIALADRDLRPAYYDDFHCLAQDCRLSCCTGWHIAFNKRDYLDMKQRRSSPELSERMSSSLQRLREGSLLDQGHYAEFRMKEDGDCPLHCQNGLCALQLEHGPDALPKVCKTFPRLARRNWQLERSLSPACEAVLHLLWDHPEGMDFRTDPISAKEQYGLALDEFSPLGLAFPQMRELCIDILQDRRMPLTERILLVGLMLHDLDQGEHDTDSVALWLGRCRQILDSPDVAALGGKLSIDPGPQETLLCLSNALRLLRLNGFADSNPVIRDMRKDVLDACRVAPTKDGHGFSFEAAPYLAAKERFKKQFAGREYFFENLAVTVWFYLGLPRITEGEKSGLWEGYVGFCNLISLYRFMAIMSCREGTQGSQADLFDMAVLVSRSMIHDQAFTTMIRDELVDNSCASPAHMAILLCG